MQTNQYQWAVANGCRPTVRRYCPQCGTRTEFRDSGRRRNNANGKNIHCYAIYKCTADHTWNRRLGSHYRPDVQPPGASEEETLQITGATLTLDTLQRDPVDIQLAAVDGPVRLDQLLTEQCSGLSRSMAQQWIRQGRVLVDGRPSKASFRPRTGQTVRIQAAAGEQENHGSSENDTTGACHTAPQEGYDEHCQDPRAQPAATAL